MKSRITILVTLLSLVLTNVVALNNYTGGNDEGRYAQTSQAKSTIDVEYELGTIFGFDFATNQGGFKQIVDLDFTYTLNPFTMYKTDLDGIDYDAPYGVVEVAGGHIELNINDQIGDKASINPLDLTINYELIYGKIMFDPFYLLVAASSKGNHYDRNNGWDFSRGSSRIRANLAHIDYNIPWKGVVSSGPWSTSGGADNLDEEAADSMLGLGFIAGTTEMMLQVGSAADWETNTENQFDFGFQLESNPVGNLTLKLQSFTGLNYDVMPLSVAVGAGYYQELTSDMALVPFAAVDVAFGDEEPSADTMITETSVGITLRWPGSVGWGYEPLKDSECDRFSGLTIGSTIYAKPEKDAKISFAVTSFEETDGGLIPRLGSSIVLEFLDVTDSLDVGFNQIGFGIYLDYNVMDIMKPFTRVKKTEGLEDSPVNFEIGVEYTAIPNTIITVGYDSADLSDIANNKGLFYTEFKVVL